jgi:hypothetical protein
MPLYSKKAKDFKPCLLLVFQLQKARYRVRCDFICARLRVAAKPIPTLMKTRESDKA